jgi:hypothetical protein
MNWNRETADRRCTLMRLMTLMLYQILPTAHRELVLDRINTNQGRVGYLNPANNLIFNILSTASRSRPRILLGGLIFLIIQVRAQAVLLEKIDSCRNEIAFVSDTQTPTWIEKLFLRANHNTRATQLIFNDIIQRRPRCLFILGDVVSLGRKEIRWKAMDQNLNGLESKNISVYGLLGNHDVMGNPNKGEKEFNKRFPDQANTGYFIVVDSIGVVLLNSNFNRHFMLKRSGCWMKTRR